MAASTVKRGFEGKIYIGAAGSTAATQLTERTDITLNLTSETADSTAAGTGASVPLKTEEIVAISCEVSWSMIYTTEDSNIATMINAAAAGTPIAVKVIRHATDSDAFDGDGFLDFGSSMPLSDNQKFEVTLKPTRRLRAPVFG